MDYEKKYKNALNWIESIYPTLQHEQQMEAEGVFSELAESEDERIRKELIKEIKGSEMRLFETVSNDEFVAWLEKQGKSKEKPTKEQVWDYCSKISHEWWQAIMDKWKTLTDEEKDKYNQFIGFNDFSDILMNITAGALFQLRDTGKLEYEEGSLLVGRPDDTPKPLEVTNVIKERQGKQSKQGNYDAKDYHSIDPYFGKPIDKAETEFTVGHWIVRGDTIAQILDIQEQYYVGLDINGRDFTMSKFLSDDKVHLWTIEDVKDGDVLVDIYGNIGIYLRHNDFDWRSYCSFRRHGGFQPFIVNHEIEGTHPATPTQRDLLFQKMGEAGYIWDDHAKMLICSTDMKSK